MIIYFDYWEVLISIFVIYVCTFSVFKFFFKKNWIYMMYFTIFYIYLAEVVNLTQFPIYAMEGMVAEGNSIWNGLSLVPFSSIDVNNYFLNICLTIPFGFGLPFLMHASWKKIMIASVIFILIIEFSQFIIGVSVGYMFRVFDVDDILFNFVGCMIGYVCFQWFQNTLMLLYRGDKSRFPVLFRDIMRAK
ncbi:VanZ family protein [Listeria rustica]|uniref:VanZ family protein n=1 Tax=Listeria rustica TaxID=2713503 RepID=A0A7W1YFT8_9LIST|nr:VanZ family protein [Listeria rustica]MBA3925997.1 VanZ family protein [Listeria rustica]